MGRTVLVALFMSAAVAVILGISIPWQVERHLVNGELNSLARVVDDLSIEGLIPGPTEGIDFNLVDNEIQRRMLGREVVRVKVWAPDGTVIYSDLRELVDRRFDLTDDLTLAFDGVAQHEVPDLSLPENAGERGLGDLREFYVPVVHNGEVEAVFEVYEVADPLLATVAEIRTYVWISIAVGISILAIFILLLILRQGAIVTDRRRQAERLLGELVRAQENERSRIIGALHDDIGQPMYRIHYGIEDVRSRLEPDSGLADELERVGGLVKEVDRRLRTELRTLADEPGTHMGLIAAIHELAESVEIETDLTVDVVVDGPCDLPVPQRVALFRAAREAVTNARRHAGATHMTLSLGRDGDVVTLDVLDDGIGFASLPGMGLTTARARLETVGGGLRVKRRRSGGARFRAWVPASDGEEAG